MNGAVLRLKIFHFHKNFKEISFQRPIDPKILGEYATLFFRSCLKESSNTYFSAPIFRQMARFNVMWRTEQNFF